MSKQLGYIFDVLGNILLCEDIMDGIYIQNMMKWDNDTKSSTANDSSSLAEKESRKRLQNRKAQKAFRLRKEAKMIELEQKLNESKMIQSKLYDKVNKLKDENILMSKMYRQLNKLNQSSLSYTSNSKEKYDVVFPTMNEFYNSLIDTDSKLNSKNSQVVDLQYNDDDGNILLTVPATWKYLLDLHERESSLKTHNINNSTTTTLGNDDEMDIDLIMSSLRGHEVCHGHGPAYKKSLIDQLVKYHRK